MSSYHKRDVNFVAPAPRQRVEIIEVTPAQLPAPPQTVLLPHAGYEDRARGFGIATAPLATVAGIVAALVGIIGWQVPLASLATLLLALAGFALVWLAAYIVHTFVSPDGATFAHVVMMWAFLRREQSERHRRYARLHEGRGDTHE